MLVDTSLTLLILLEIILIMVWLVWEWWIILVGLVYLLNVLPQLLIFIFDVVIVELLVALNWLQFIFTHILLVYIVLVNLFFQKCFLRIYFFAGSIYFLFSLFFPCKVLAFIILFLKIVFLIVKWLINLFEIFILVKALLVLELLI